MVVTIIVRMFWFFMGTTTSLFIRFMFSSNVQQICFPFASCVDVSLVTFFKTRKTESSGLYQMA
jgi:hypothetical protein